jgi:hypothetical protein
VSVSGTQTVGTPFRIGIPSAPGYVPKYESNDRFSCMTTTTCLILWMPGGGVRACAGSRGDEGVAGGRMPSWSSGAFGCGFVRTTASSDAAATAQSTTTPRRLIACSFSLSLTTG